MKVSYRFSCLFVVNFLIWSPSTFAAESYQSPQCKVFKYIGIQPEKICDGHALAPYSVNPCRCVDSGKLKPNELSNKSAIAKYYADSADPKSADFGCYRIEKQSDSIKICRLEPIFAKKLPEAKTEVPADTARKVPNKLPTPEKVDEKLTEKKVLPNQTQPKTKRPPVSEKKSPPVKKSLDQKMPNPEKSPTLTEMQEKVKFASREHPSIRAAFKTDSADFLSREEAINEIKSVVEFLKKNPDLKIKLLGMSQGSTLDRLKIDQMLIDQAIEKYAVIRKINFFSSFGTEAALKKFYPPSQLEDFKKLFLYMNVPAKYQNDYLVSIRKLKSFMRLARAKRVAETMIELGLQQSRILEFKAADLDDVRRINSNEELNRRVDIDYSF